MQYAVIPSLMAALALSLIADPPTGVRVIPGVPLTPTQAPGGDFSVAVPAGWIISGSAQADSFTIAPVGKMQPSVTFTIIGVSDLRYAAQIKSCTRSFHPFGDILTTCVIPAVRMQLQDSSFPWTPQQAAQAILQRLQQTGRVSFGPPRFTTESATKIYYKVSSTGISGPLENWGTITVFHLPNQILGPGMVTSLAWIAGCSAPAGEAETFYDTCAGIIHSTRPAPGWATRFATALVTQYQQEAQALISMGRAVIQNSFYRSQMITAAGQAVQQMQMDTFFRRQAQIVHDADHWSAALRGEDIVRDPRTGMLYPVPHGYQQYCGDDNLLNPTIIAGNGLDVKLGSWAGNHQCTQILPRVD